MAFRQGRYEGARDERRRQQQRVYNQRYYQKVKARQVQPKIVMKLLTLRVPESYIAQMTRMAMEAMALGIGPWKTIQEVARALLAAGFAQFRDHSDAMREFIPQLELEQQLQTLDRAKRSAQAMLSMAKENIGALLDIDADTTALQYYSTAVSKAKELPPTVWSTWLIKELQKTFPDLEKRVVSERVPGVRLAKSANVAKPRKRS